MQVKADHFLSQLQDTPRYVTHTHTLQSGMATEESMDKEGQEGSRPRGGRLERWEPIEGSIEKFGGM
eukprot:2913832-Amphidinium_carterae.1